jgi:hypothetical protein
MHCHGQISAVTHSSRVVRALGHASRKVTLMLLGSSPMTCGFSGGQGRDRTGDLPLFRRTLVPTELPGPEGTGPVKPKCLADLATLTGLEPATSAVTGRRANQLRHRALLCDSIVRGVACTPYGIRTRATALKGRRPRPLDEGGQPNLSGVLTTL